MRNFIIIFVISCALFSCSKKTDLESALELADRNRIELEKVLKHYANDTLKYRAACFLIENMPDYQFYTGNELDYQKRFFQILHDTGLSPEAIADSLDKERTLLIFNPTKQCSDILEITSTYLIDNINWAFKVWEEQPWGKNVSFENFCEYILPYRIGDEDLTVWREKIYNKYNPLLDSVRYLPDAEDPLFVSQILFDLLRKYPGRFTTYPYFDYHVGPTIVEWRSGSCRDLTDMVIYVYRALGIPCGYDMMLMRGDNNASHYWNFTLDKNGESYFFSPLYAAGIMEASHTYWNPKGKVYRNTFSLNKNMIDSLGEKPENIHPTFQRPFMHDVTSAYTDFNQTLQIAADKFYFEPKKNEIIYLCLSDRKDWIPVAWSRYQKKEALFKDVEGGVVFRLATYKNNCLHLLTDAFFAEKETGEIRFFESENELENIVLFHKFNLFIEPFIDRMPGGVFEASNRSDFSVKDTLFIIKEKPVRLLNVAPVNNNRRKYRYVRYYGPSEGYCNVSEIAFFETDNDTLPLQGKPMGTQGWNPMDKSHEYTNAFDGDPYTSFDYHLPAGGWTGLDLGTPRRIGKIIFTPRNRDNFIRKDDQYELFFDKKGIWESAGMIAADSDSLVYTIPKGALLYLQNHTRGVDERIFEYSNGKQIFW